MTTSFANEPKHWRDRAAQMRALAEKTDDDVAKQMMLQIAKDYEKLALRAEFRAVPSRLK
jgi:hypothetical protein